VMQRIIIISSEVIVINLVNSLMLNYL